MKKVLIIEDDHFSARRLKRLIMDIDDTIDVHGPLKDVAEVTRELSTCNDYDLVFSDIRLADGDVFDAFREVMPQSFVIFTTAYDEYAMEAIKNNGLDYLMKPVDANELRAAMNKLSLISATGQEDRTSPAGNIPCQRMRYKKRFLVPKGDELCMLHTDDISYICTENNRVIAHACDGTSYPLPLNMYELEQALDPDTFFRINRQYIASIKGIKKISLFFSSKLIVKLQGCPDDNIIISKEKTTLLKKWLDR